MPPQAQCQEVRKRKELELQILTEAIRSWEGDDIKTLGSVVYMSQVLIQCAGSEVLPSAFPALLLPWGNLSPGPLRLAGFPCRGHGSPESLHCCGWCLSHELPFRFLGIFGLHLWSFWGSS